MVLEENNMVFTSTYTTTTTTNRYSPPYKSQFDSIERLRLLLKEGYWIRHISHPRTINGFSSTMVELIKKVPEETESGCLISVYGEEAEALSEFIGIPTPVD